MGKKRILIADDEEAVRFMLAKALGVFDVEIDIVENGVEAIHQIDKESYDLIITDYMMPEMDGLELTQKIRSQDPSAPPIIVITGKGPIEELLKSGATACVNKPCSIIELQNMVKQILNQYE